jgi:hypothetical protein
VACRDGSELGPPAETCLPVEAHNAKDVSCHSWDGYCDALVRHRVDKCSELSMVWAARRRFDQLRLCQLRAMPGEKQLVRSQPHVSAADRGAAVTPQAEWASRKTVTAAPFEDAARGGRPRCLCGHAREIAPATLSSTLRNRPAMQMPTMRLPAPNSRCSRRRAHTAAAASAHRPDAEAASRACPRGPILVRLDARVAWRGNRQHSGRQSRGSSGSRALSVRRGGAQIGRRSDELLIGPWAAARVIAARVGRPRCSFTILAPAV